MKILYVDMDGVLVNPNINLTEFDNETKEKFKNNLYDAPGFFSKLEPMDGAIESYKYLSKKYRKCHNFQHRK